MLELPIMIMRSAEVLIEWIEHGEALLPIAPGFLPAFQQHAFTLAHARVDWDT